MLLHRSSEKYPEVKGDRWDIVGGRIESGTPLFENLKREIKEEVGLDLVEEPRLVAAQDILRNPARHVVRLTYVGKIEGEPVLDGDHDEYRWFSREELFKLDSLDRYFKELLEKGAL